MLVQKGVRVAAGGRARIMPMKTSGTEHFIERTYREGGAYQWVRETLFNATEANATRIEYGIEWQAVENRSVYRRVIADNGDGYNVNTHTRRRSKPAR